MLGPRTVSRPMNSGRSAAFVSLFRLRVEVTFCWSPAERLPSSANSLLLASQLQALFPELVWGARKALRVSADGRFTRLLPRSRWRLVLSSMNAFCSKLLASGASLMECDQVYEALTWKPWAMRCWKFTIIAL